ncbi:hypothetical protein Poli38472_009170 [Pythium oligandrum]|uniref:DUSP domain-containing protein n=1 Tax=Pythium oligandrum TaxID=41045 RepID=A0A8K1CMF9_PYTOL|nr:hypothetical protein Poli38472_009170 [Pythium oligandrum]|eukprot:TMW65003.1 hypothetical protein Poli38472_009170 [Pythium oligandrum]
MGVLPVEKAREVTTKAYEELHVPVGSPSEQVVTAFRTLCLQRVFNIQLSAADGPEQFQRQAVAYRFLRSLPLLDKTEYAADAIIARLKPLDAYSLAESSERASPMLDLSIAMMEQAQKTWQLPYTNYVISVHYCLRKHVVRRRYSEFEALHRVLSEKLPVIPTLPERHWLYKLRLPSERAQSLTQYLLRVIIMLSNRGLFSLEIMQFLEIDHRRIRAEEEAHAVDFLARAASSGGSNAYYIISSGWLDAWKHFVCSEGYHPPGKINNEHLLERRGVAKKDLDAGRHYRCVNFHTWQYLTMIYGGGPAILRRSPLIYGRVVYDNHTFAILLQRIVRGFLGRVRARRRRLYILRQNPFVERHLGNLERQQQLENRMDMVRQYVGAREFQIRHVASIKIQRVFRKYLLRQEHALLLAESAVPHATDHFQHIEEYFSLEEIGLIRDPQYRLAHFLVTMNKGVPIQKLRSRRKAPKWSLFKIDAIGSQLMWSSTKRSYSLVFVDVTKLVVESQLQLKSGFGRRRSIVHDHAVVLTYNENNVSTDLILLCESQCDCDALFFGLEALVSETQTRTARGASYVDGHGVIRKKYPHAKRLIHDAHQLIDQQHRSPFQMAGGTTTKA